MLATDATTSLVIKLADDTQPLKEVMGYSTQEHRSIMGTMSSTSGRGIAAQPVAAAAQAI